LDRKEPDFLVIDLHTHILPGLDDGPKNWDEALAMARAAAADGVTGVVATPHLFENRGIYQGDLNGPERILPAVQEFRQKLAEAGINLDIFPGCEAPLFLELLEFLEKGLVLTINGNKRYLCLELPDTVIPPGTEDFIFSLHAAGIIPIITHPERNMALQEMPHKLLRLLDLGCLAQITAASLLGGFGRRVAKFTEQLVRKGFVHIMASDAHSVKRRPPVLSQGVKKLASLVGEARAWDMVATLPARIVRGEPVLSKD
jgi:protein-tyrosine phosphatase